MTSVQETPPLIFVDHRLVLSFEILEPSLDKFHHLPMDLLDLGRLLALVF